jgi:mannose-6-phosphate isomerase-like protein (cupin superfamily)
VSDRYEPLHPAVLRLIRQVRRGAVRQGIPVAVCGEMASDPLLLRLLIGCGLTEFSMTPGALLMARRVVAETGAGEMARIAARVMTLGTVEEIERVLVEYFGRDWRIRLAQVVARGRRAGKSGDQVSVTRVDKPWGYELHWAKTDRYVGKVLHINAGHALSLQYHNKKDETIYVHSGKMLFEIGPKGGPLEKREMGPAIRCTVTPLTVHRMTALEDCDSAGSLDARTRRRREAGRPVRARYVALSRPTK